MRLLMMASLVLAFSCGSISRSDHILAFIPGDYEHPFDDDLSRGIIVSRITPVQGGHYGIERLSAVIRKRNGIELPVKYDTACWTAIYDEQRHALYEQQKGKILLFFPKESKLMIGSSEYQKIK